MSIIPLPYWRLSSFYFFYFASLGVLVPYWSLYLKWQGFSAYEIGELTALLLATRVLAPNIWGWIADHLGQHIQVVRWTSLASSLVFSGVLFLHSYFSLAIILLTFSFFWSAALPQFEAITLRFLDKKTNHYSKIRLWGSIGFIVTVSLLGYFLEKLNAGIIPYVMLINLLAIWLISLQVPDTSHRVNAVNESILTILKRRDVLAFLTVCFLLQFSHGPYYTFYTLYLEMHHYTRSLIGLLWAIGVIAEVIIFLFMHRWLPRYGLSTVLLSSLLLSTLRWMIIGFYPDSLYLLLFAQLLHAASFGAFHAAAIAWIHRLFNGKNLARGQALYSSIGFGAGGASGSLLCGYTWLSPGPVFTFSLAAMISFIAFLIGLRYLR